MVGISLIDSKDSRWISTSLLHSRAYQYANAKVYVFSDSVPCLGRKGHNPVESWKKQIQWYSETNYFSELNRIDGKPMEFEWKIFPGFTTAGLLEEIQKKWANYSVIQRISKTGLSSCQFSTTLNEMQKEMKNYVEKSKKVEEYARRFPRGHWSFLGPGSEKKWYTAEKIMQIFQRSGHPIFRCTSALERGQLRCKGGGKTTIHFNGST